MAMSKEDAVAKVARLLTLAESQGADPNEAAVAAAQAAGIMERYKLERAVINHYRTEPGEAVSEYNGADSLIVGARIPHWRLQLALGISEVLTCKVLYRRGHDKSGKRCSLVSVIGRPSDVSVLRYLFRFCDREITRLARVAVKDGFIHGRTGGNNYRHGAVMAVVDTLRREQRQTRETFVAEHGTAGTAAIVKLDATAGEVELFVAKYHPKLRNHRGTSARGDDWARRVGYRDGKSIRVNRGLAAGAEPTPELPRR